MKLLLSLCLLIFSTLCYAEVNDIIRPNFYYLVSWSSKVCVRAPCPQYTIQNLNSATTRSILGINIPAALKSYEKYLTLNESNSVIIYGNVSPSPQYPTEATDLNIVRAFKKLPLGNTAAATDKFYLFTDNGMRCVKAPCDSITAILANLYGQTQKVNTVKQPYQANVGSLFDSVWLSSKTVRSDDNGIIGQATINSNGEVIISNSYVRLPDPSSKCPALPLLKCQANNVVIYTRDENRCLADPNCTESGFCTLSIPVCPEGYYLDSWKGAKFGCNNYHCDAYFLPKTH
ncbi:hypothetical protein DICPUDRAFT_150105 [Dictyostelium purpureum]|uniref:Uncharacterized protein n=1 Tax=Dictyostelium purpureum TaxID=5786 RepID=F0ZFG3_DICPU|nr:uncharacterized protein DICPUDRAFT_150105 [Dictyostelium purpureum]EGC37345.1 hypothetical protein DICPUDRAFT_150105 [Dictyostelium purpureum]|eukprot:XP_003286159.1 hypothetical protein DICPUDRAFT_150105 [Dictyostelium purpureum]